MKIDISRIIICGPDLSGKSTLCKGLHKCSGYRWNIHDRSTMSMLVHAKQYNRDVSLWERKFREEVSDLRNVFVVLLPDKNVLEKRYFARGDAIQDLRSILSLAASFEDITSAVDCYPNMLVHREEFVDPAEVKNEILEYGTFPLSLPQIREALLGAASCSITKEIRAVYMDDADKVHDGILRDSREGSHYRKIDKKFREKIQAELRGENEYNEKQTALSRRFIWTSDTCISLLHAKVIDSVLCLSAYLRSTHVSNNAGIDTEFLRYEAYQAAKLLGVTGPRRIDVTYACPHMQR